MANAARAQLPPAVASLVLGVSLALNGFVLREVWDEVKAIRENDRRQDVTIAQLAERLAAARELRAPVAPTYGARNP